MLGMLSFSSASSHTGHLLDTRTLYALHIGTYWKMYCKYSRWIMHLYKLPEDYHFSKQNCDLGLWADVHSCTARPDVCLVYYTAIHQCCQNSVSVLLSTYNWLTVYCQRNIPCPYKDRWQTAQFDSDCQMKYRPCTVRLKNALQASQEAIP